jgi:ATP adenylyltransferase
MANEPGLDRLWSPWRMEYIRRAGSKRSGAKRLGAPPCLFCHLRESRTDRADLVLARRPHAFLLLNRFPYNPAHLMVAVSAHRGQVHDLDDATRVDLLALTALAERALAAEYHPDGINLGANIGRVAGAGFPGHLHLHLVPRWSGDTNFMPVVGATRVLPESLDRTWRRLRAAIRLLESPRRGSRAVSRRVKRGQGR